MKFELACLSIILFFEIQVGQGWRPPPGGGPGRPPPGGPPPGGPGGNGGPPPGGPGGNGGPPPGGPGGNSGPPPGGPGGNGGPGGSSGGSVIAGAGAISGTGLTNSGSTYAGQLASAAVSQIQSNTCGGTTSAQQCNGNCYGSASSVFVNYVEGNYRLLVANGIPDHVAQQGAVSPNPNTACENKAFILAPSNPTITGYTASGLGPIGITVSGAFIYNHLSNPTGVNDIAVVNEGSSFDSCNGHSDPTCLYHYHDDPVCIDSSNPCPLVGYLRDGFPIYGYCTVDGVQLTSCYSQTSGDGSSSSDFTYAQSANCHLDENNGYSFADGSYGYVITNSYPYTPTGYMGQDYGICYFQ